MGDGDRLREVVAYGGWTVIINGHNYWRSMGDE